MLGPDFCSNFLLAAITELEAMDHPTLHPTLSLNLIQIPALIIRHSIPSNPPNTNVGVPRPYHPQFAHPQLSMSSSSISPSSRRHFLIKSNKFSLASSQSDTWSLGFLLPFVAAGFVDRPGIFTGLVLRFEICPRPSPSVP